MKQAIKIIALTLATLIAPQTAFASTGDAYWLETAIQDYSNASGGTGTLSVQTSGAGAVATVTGTITGATATLDLIISSGVTLFWRATLSGSTASGTALVSKLSAGNFEVQSGKIEQTGAGNAIYIGNQGSTTSNLTVSGGTVSATTGHAIYNNVSVGSDYYATVTISGGVVFARKSSAAIGATANNVIYSNVVTNSSVPVNPSGTGLIIGWSTPNTTTYTAFATSGIVTLPTGKARWLNNNGSGGIDYDNDGNTGFIPLAVTVNKATPTATFPTASGITYDPAKTLVDVAFVGGAGDGTFAWKTPTTVPTVSVSSYPAVFTPTDAANYATRESNISLTVSKADPTVTWPTAATITYGAALSTSALSGGSITGTFAWTTPATIPTVTNSGYSVTFTPTDAANYNTATQTVAITVNKAPVTNIGVPGSVTYSSSVDLRPSFTIAPNAGTPTYSIEAPGSMDVTTVGGIRVYAKIPKAGTYIVGLETAETPNYAAGAKVTATLTVNKADPTVTSWPTAAAITYGAVLSTSALSGGTTTGTFAWTAPATIPTVTNSGYSVTFTPNDADNYNTATQTVAITVSKAPLTLTADNKTIFIDDPEPSYTYTVAGLIGNDKAEDVITTPPAMSVAGFSSASAGTFTIAITGGATTNANYSIANRTGGTLTVTDKTIVSITGNIASKTYNGTQVTPSAVTVKNGASTVADYAALVYTYTNTADGTTGATAPKNAGSYTLVISTAASDAKYRGNSDTIPFTISKATVTITAADKTATRGAAQPAYTYTVAGLAIGESLSTIPTVSCPTANMNAAGTYPIVASGAAVPNTDNYNAAITYVNGTLTVNEITYSITVQTDGNGTASASASSATAGAQITLTASPNSGYQFSSWQVVSGGVTIASNKFTMPANSVTVKANFAAIYTPPPTTPTTPTGYTITFDPTGGTVSPATATTGANGRLSSLPTARMPGYDFSGWFMSMAGGEAVTTGTVFTVNTIVYARWALRIKTITFNANGGTVAPSSVELGTNGRLESLPVPTRSGYDFDGWFTEADGGLPITTGTFFSISGNYVIYAHWTPAVSVSSSEREIPKRNPEEQAVVAPIAKTATGISVGPNPASRSAGAVSIYRNGGKPVKGTLAVFDAVGNKVAKINIAGAGAKKVGEWGVSGVAEGAYLIKGVLTDENGGKVRVSTIIAIVR